MLSAVSEVDPAARSHKHRLLPEPEHLNFVNAVSGYALRGEDLYALSDWDIRCLIA
jgi:hypothetical protein